MEEAKTRRIDYSVAFCHLEYQPGCHLVTLAVIKGEGGREGREEVRFKSKHQPNG